MSPSFLIRLIEQVAVKRLKYTKLDFLLGENVSTITNVCLVLVMKKQMYVLDGLKVKAVVIMVNVTMICLADSSLYGPIVQHASPEVMLALNA